VIEKPFILKGFLSFFPVFRTPRAMHHRASAMIVAWPMKK
jgi:hypothetical protein